MTEQDMKRMADSYFAGVERMTGYCHSSYAESLAEFGMPRELPRCGGWILERQIPGSSYRDGMGCYPLFACRDWSKLHDDLAEIGNDMVSLSIVTDPFGDYDLDLLRKCFDVVMPFKEHYVVNLAQPIEAIVSKSHRSTVRRAMRKVEVSWSPTPCCTWVTGWICFRIWSTGTISGEFVHFRKSICETTEHSRDGHVQG